MEVLSNGLSGVGVPAAGGCRRPVVAVCGASRIIDPAVASLARALGAEIAGLGMNLICGGMRGVMEEVCRGAFDARAQQGSPTIIVGVVPSSRAADANPYCDLVLPTGMGIARNVLVVLAGDAVILVGGGSGTLSEAAFAWQLGKPLVALAPSGGWAAELAGRTLDQRRSDTVRTANSAGEALAQVSELLGLLPAAR
jgi:uncharacterized protein (TIGR00725 family)